MVLIAFIQNNVLFLDGQAKLNDFGISRVLDDAEGLSSRVHGSCRFLAPEILRAKETSNNCVSTASDIFSFGRVLYQVRDSSPRADLITDFVGSA